MPKVVKACSPPISKSAANSLQRVATLLAYLWIGLFPSVAQNLVVNGGFSRATLTGWSGSPEIIGYVGSFKYGTSLLSDWIGLNGELYQDVPTEPGQYYTLSFETQGYDPNQSWRPNDLDVFFNDTLVAHYEFPFGEYRFFTPRLVVKATSATTRIRFVGRAYVSLDSVTLTPSIPTQFFGTITEPSEGFKVKEGQPLQFDSSWQTLNGSEKPSPIKYILDGVTEIGRSPSDSSRFQWASAISGTHYITAEFGTGRTPPVRIVVDTIPKVIVSEPLDGAAFQIGGTVSIAAQLQDNSGADKIMSVRFYVAGEIDRTYDGNVRNISFDWVPSKVGDYELNLVGTKADGSQSVRRTLRLHVMPIPVLDLDLGEGGGSISYQATTLVAQTFIPTLNGRLQSIVLYGGHNNGSIQSPITVAIHDVVDGLPGTNRLGEVTRTFAQAWINPMLSEAASFPFVDTRVSLVRGRPYALVLETHAPLTDASYFRAVPGYPGGNLFQRINGKWQPMSNQSDPTVPYKLTLKTFMEPDQTPSAVITSPSNLASFNIGADIPIEAIASDPDDRVTGVHLEVNGARVATLTDAPYSFVWTNAPSGNHLIRVVAEDEIGATGSSDLISIVVGPGFEGLPSIRALDTASPEGNSSLPPLVFRLLLSNPSPGVVSVDYKTRDATATALNDYLTTTGRVEFAPGQVEAYVFVRILGDAHEEPNKRLTLELSNPKGCILERPAAVGVILDDEAGPGKVTAYEWELGAADREALKPFPVKLVARDAANGVVRDSPGPIRLEVEGPAGASRTAMISTGFPREGTQVNNTSGFGFLVMRDMWVTHLRCLAGVKVTLWEETGQMLATSTFQYKSRVWQEVPLSHPIRLRAGRRFRIATYSGEPSREYESDASPDPGDFQIYWSYIGYGDTFPKETFNNAYQLADFRYQLSAPRPEASVIPHTVELVNGEWAGTLRVVGTGSDFQLTATDLLGRIGRSSVFSLKAIQDVRFETISSAGSLTFRAVAPAGYKVRVESSEDFIRWVPIGAPWISDDNPPLWEPPQPNAGTQFFRLVVVE